MVPSLLIGTHCIFDHDQSQSTSCSNVATDAGEYGCEAKGTQRSGTGLSLSELLSESIGPCLRIQPLFRRKGVHGERFFRDSARERLLSPFSLGESSPAEMDIALSSTNFSCFSPFLVGDSGSIHATSLLRTTGWEGLRRSLDRPASNDDLNLRWRRTI